MFNTNQLKPLQTRVERLHILFIYSLAEISIYGNWIDCAYNDTCAEACMTKYLNYDRRQDCGRGNAASRTCADYGIIYTFGFDACAQRDRKMSDVKQYEKWMSDTCGTGPSHPQQKPNSKLNRIVTIAKISILSENWTILCITILACRQVSG